MFRIVHRVLSKAKDEVEPLAKRMSLKSVGLVSGGLDSALAAKIIRLQGIDVLGIAFITPFTYPSIEKLAQNIGIEIKLIDISSEYLDIVKNPSFGFGRNMNPCIDCHIFMLKKAKEFMIRHKANFIISGEVLGQRPMSQNEANLRKIERESSLEGMLLRPLSAKLLSPTIPEQGGLVQRERLFDFSGRSRRPQMELARQLGLEGFSQPAGGCLLTDPGFSQRLKDLLKYKADFKLDNVELLKLGRHFRLSAGAKLVIGRDQEENERLSILRGGNILLEPIDIPGPTAILDAEIISQELLESSAAILARYCDKKSNLVSISVENGKSSQIINCSAIEPDNLEALRI